MSRQHLLAVAAAALALGAATPAFAQSVRVKCELRSDRSTASVDGSGLGAGQYHAVLVSGGHSATTPDKAAVAGQAEFDFSSQARDIRQGATALTPTFLASGQATGRIYTAAGRLVASSTVACRVR